MKYPVKTNEINAEIQFCQEVIEAHHKSTKYLESQKWCSEIRKGWLFTNIGYAVCIFLFDIENTQSPPDHLIWVMVGDFPPMYLDTFSVHTTKEVVANYIYLAQEWIEAAEIQSSLEEYYPFEIASNKEVINLFKRKVEMLKREILENITDLNFSVIECK